MAVQLLGAVADCINLPSIDSGTVTGMGMCFPSHSQAPQNERVTAFPATQSSRLPHSSQKLNRPSRSRCATGTSPPAAELFAGRCEPAAQSNGSCVGPRPLGRQHRENDQRGTDGLGSVAGANPFAMRVGGGAVVGCCRRLHRLPQRGFWQVRETRVCARHHTVKRSEMSGLA
jgi:hypothetical protein